MAKATKGARHITVGEVKFRWRATGNDGWISLTIWPAELSGPVIACSLSYDQTPVPRPGGATSLTHQVVVTNRIVRQVIELATSQFAYDPNTKGKQLNLRNVDKMISMTKAIRAD